MGGISDEGYSGRIILSTAVWGYKIMVLLYISWLVYHIRPSSAQPLQVEINMKTWDKTNDTN